jgi:hypothetical protein
LCTILIIAGNGGSGKAIIMRGKTINIEKLKCRQLKGKVKSGDIRGN